VCCSKLQCVAVCCSVLQCVAMCCIVYMIFPTIVACVSVYVLQCVAMCCSVLQCSSVTFSVYMMFLFSHTRSICGCGKYDAMNISHVHRVG